MRALRLLLIASLFQQGLFTPASGGPGVFSLEFKEGFRRKGAEGCPFSAMIAGRGGNGGPLTFNSNNLPAGATLVQTGPRTALIEWNTIPFNSPSSVDINVSASGSDSGSATLSVSISDAISIPVFKKRLPETAVALGSAAQVNLEAWDPEGDSVSFSLVTPDAYANGTKSLLDNGDGTAVVSFTPAATGSHYIQVRISDPSGNARTFPLYFRAGDAVSSVQAGAWNSGSTWSTGTPPDSSSLVSIHHAVSLQGAAQAVDVTVHNGGSLTFSRSQSSTLELRGSLMIMDGAQLDVGTQASPIPPNVSAEIRLAVVDDALVVGASPFYPGPDVNSNDTRMGDVGIQAMGDGAVLSLNGAGVVKTWNRLIEDAKPGSTVVRMDGTISDWPVGAAVLITPLEDPNKTEIRFITDVRPGTPNELVLDAPLAYFHPGSRYAHDPATGDIRLLGASEAPASGETLVLEQCEVALLSRNVRVLSDLIKGAGHAHTLFMMGASGNIQYAELRNLGPMKLGRYSIHIHRTQSLAFGTMVEGNSIYNTTVSPLNKAITVHTSGGVKILKNVIKGPIKGSLIYLEDAEEEDNEIRNNIMVGNAGPEPFPQPHLAAAFGYDVNLAVALWGRTGNIYTDNVVIAGPTSTAIGVTPLNLPNSRPIDITMTGNHVRGGGDGMAYLGKAVHIDFKDGQFVANKGIASFITDQPNGLLDSVLFGNLGQPADNAALQIRYPGQRIERNVLLVYAKDPAIVLDSSSPGQVAEAELTLDYVFSDGFWRTSKSKTFSLVPGQNRLTIEEIGRSGQPMSVEWLVTYNAAGGPSGGGGAGPFKNFGDPGDQPFKIGFDVASPSQVKASVFDRWGRLVKNVLDEHLPAGFHTASWDGTNRAGDTVASGLYFLALQKNGGKATKHKLMVVR